MKFTPSYSPGYFSIEDFLATQERVPCKILVNMPKMGVLNPSSDSDDLKAGTSLELPFWLAGKLAQGRHTQIASAELPRIFRDSYREILKADPCAVDLHKFNMNFYEFGNYARQFDIRSDVKKSLLHTFRHRFRNVMDLANNADSDPTQNSRLDMLERRLYATGLEARSKLNTWLIESKVPLEASAMVTSHKKRKRVEIEDL